MKELKVVDEDAHGGKQHIVLCHYALRTFNKMHYGAWQLYGHSHGSLEDLPHMLSMDVGVDATKRYGPISYEDVKQRMSTKTWKPVDIMEGAHRVLTLNLNGLGNKRSNNPRLEKLTTPGKLAVGTLNEMAEQRKVWPSADFQRYYTQCGCSRNTIDRVMKILGWKGFGSSRSGYFYRSPAPTVKNFLQEGKEVLRIKIELLPYGSEEHRYDIGELFVINDGTGNSNVGNYRFLLRCISGGWKETSWEGSVVAFSRQESNAWELVARCLAQVDFACPTHSESPAEFAEMMR